MHEHDLVISHPEPQDIPIIEQLWVDVFGDPPELVEAFYDAFPPALHGWVLRRGEEILSCAYLLHGNLFLSGKELRAAAYVYAVATPLRHRGKGYAGRLMQYFTQLADQRELVLYTRPATQGLFHWYAEVMQTCPATSVAPVRITASGDPSALTPRRVSPVDYGMIREARLEGTPHIALSADFLKLQETFLEGEGAGYYAVGPHCCTCEQRDGILLFKELLATGDQISSVAQAMLHALSIPEGIFYLPSRSGTPTVAYRSNHAPMHTRWGLLLD